MTKLTWHLLPLAAALAACSDSRAAPGATGSSTAAAASSGATSAGSGSSAGSTSGSGASTSTTGGAGSASGVATGNAGGDAGPDAGPPQVAGLPCQSDQGCVSGSCAPNGICCANACHSVVAACAASCAVGSGACVYPDAGTVCSEPLCQTSAVYPAGHCDGQGDCTQPPLETCFPYGCLTLQTCAVSCAVDTDCNPAASCLHSEAGNRCVVPLASGEICSEDNNCSSQACAGGRCCVPGCRGNQGVCGPQTCDASGACLGLGPSGTQCIAAVCNIDAFQPASTCDGGGYCVTPPSLPCSPYTCNATGCLTQCADDAQCDPGLGASYCDQGSCCSLTAGNSGPQLLVDGVAGVDGPCCGSYVAIGQGTPGAAPCRSIGYAIKRIDAYNQAHPSRAVTGIQLMAFNSDNSPDWAPDGGEPWPIQLGWGVTLNAPSLYFSAPTDAGALFLAAPFPAEPAGPTAEVYLTGSNGGDLVVGSNSLGQLTSAPAAIEVRGPATLGLFGAVWVYSAACGSPPCGPQTAIRVEAGGNLDLLSAFGSNDIGNPTLPNGTAVAAAGGTGIACGGPDSGISDVNAFAQPLLIQGMRFADLWVGSGCTAVFQNGPQFGALPNGAAVGACPTTPKVDSIGVLANGNATVNFTGNNAAPSISCQNQYGIDLTVDDAGGIPSVQMLNGRITNCGCAGISDSAGSFKGNNLQIGYNQVGAQQLGSGMLDLASGGAFGSNVSCDSRSEPSTLCQTPAGVDVLNLSTNELLAVNDFWSVWDSAIQNTLIWSCTDAAFQTCTCHGVPSLCAAFTRGQALPDGTPAAYLTSNPSLIPVDAMGRFNNGGQRSCP